MIRIILSESLSARQINRLADDLISVAHGFAECVGETLLDKADSEVSDINTDPATIKTLRDGGRSAAATERVENHIAFVRAGLDDTFEKSFGLLRGITKALCSPRDNGGEVSPNVLKSNTRHFVQIPFVLRHSVECMAKSSLDSKLLHVVLRICPVPTAVGFNPSIFPACLWTEVLVFDISNPPLADASVFLDPPFVFCVPARPGSREVAAPKTAARLLVDEPIVSTDVRVVICRELRIPSRFLAPSVEEDNVVDVPKVLQSLFRVAVGAASLPNYFGAELLRPENGVHQHL